MLLTLQVGSKALTLRGEEAGHFREVAGMSIIDAAVRVRSRHFNGRQPSGLGKYSIFRLRDESSSGGGGLMHGIKIPQYEFAL